MRTIVLSGLGGVGKTTTALEFAHRYLSDYDLAWQFNADTDDSVSAGFVELARQLDAYDPTDPQADVVELVHRTLAIRPGRWLLLLDNAPDLVSVQRVLPPSGRGDVLITSQYFDWPESWRLIVDVLNQNSAVELLVTRSGDNDFVAATAIACELGELPLALEQAGAYSRATGLSLASYCAALRDHLDQLLLRGRQPADKTIAATLSMPLEQLERVAPSAMALLRIMAFCAPEAIPVRTLLGEQPSLTAAIVADSSRPLLPIVSMGDAINDLRRFSLCVPNSADDTISIHRLVQVSVIERLTDEQRAFWEDLVRRLIETAMQIDPEDSQNWPSFARLLPHAVKILSPNSPSMRTLGDYLHASGDYANAFTIRSRILDTTRVKHGDHHPETLQALNNVGQVLQSQGDYASARSAFEQVYQIRLRRLGDLHPETAESMNYVAEALHEQGDFQAARDWHRRALDIRLRTIGRDQLDTAKSMKNLALTLQELGNYSESLHLLEQVLEIRRRLLGDNHKDVADVMNALGLVLQDLGRYQDARSMYEQALAHFRHAYGNDHLGTASVVNNLGILLWELDDYTGARPLLEQALDIHRRILGDDHPSTAVTMNNLAACLVSQGEYSTARDLLEQSLPIRRRILGEEHPDIATTINNLATVLLKQGDRSGARKLLEDALQRQRGVFGENHVRTAAAMQNLAAVLIEMGDLAAGRDLLWRALEVRERTLGHEHPDTASLAQYLNRPLFRRSMLERLRASYKRGR